MDYKDYCAPGITVVQILSSPLCLSGNSGTERVGNSGSAMNDTMFV